MLARLQKLILTTIAIVAMVLVQGCSSPASSLKAYIDSFDGYEFLYPNGWIPVEVSSGPDVVFRDLIQETENVSVAIGPTSSDKNLHDLGTPTEVGYRMSKNAIAPPESGRTAELLNAAERERDGKTYYILEYAVQLPGGQQRHELASVAISRDKVFTINFSAPEVRWDKVRDAFEAGILSFSVY